jgi:hypothetical protein
MADILQLRPRSASNLCHDAQFQRRREHVAQRVTPGVRGSIHPVTAL